MQRSNKILGFQLLDLFNRISRNARLGSAARQMKTYRVTIKLKYQIHKMVNNWTKHLTIEKNPHFIFDKQEYYLCTAYFSDLMKLLIIPTAFKIVVLLFPGRNETSAPWGSRPHQ